MNLLLDLNNKKVVLITTAKKNAHSNLIKCLSIVQNYGRRLGFISLMYNVNDMIEEFRKNKLKSDRFFFVDVLTATTNVPPIMSNCIFVSSPDSMAEIRLSVKTLFSEKNREIVFFDSINEMAKHFGKYELTKFIHELIVITNSFSGKLIVFAQDDECADFIADISMFADKLIEL
jgi:hypothetical protein